MPEMPKLRVKAEVIDVTDEEAPPTTIGGIQERGKRLYDRLTKGESQAALMRQAKADKKAKGAKPAKTAARAQPAPHAPPAPPAPLSVKTFFEDEGKIIVFLQGNKGKENRGEVGPFHTTSADGELDVKLKEGRNGSIIVNVVNGQGLELDTQSSLKLDLKILEWIKHFILKVFSSRIIYIHGSD